MMPAIPHIRRASAYGRSRKHLEVLVALPVGDRGEVALPLVALVPVEHLVQAAWHGRLDHVVRGECLQGGAEALGHPLDLDALLEQVIRVALLGLARIELAADAVESGL